MEQRLGDFLNSHPTDEMQNYLINKEATDCLLGLYWNLPVNHLTNFTCEPQDYSLTTKYNKDLNKEELLESTEVLPMLANSSYVQQAIPAFALHTPLAQFGSPSIISGSQVKPIPSSPWSSGKNSEKQVSQSPWCTKPVINFSNDSAAIFGKVDRSKVPLSSDMEAKNSEKQVAQSPWLTKPVINFSNDSAVIFGKVDRSKVPLLPDMSDMQAKNSEKQWAQSPWPTKPVINFSNDPAVIFGKVDRSKVPLLQDMSDMQAKNSDKQGAQSPWLAKPVVNFPNDPALIFGKVDRSKVPLLQDMSDMQAKNSEIQVSQSPWLTKPAINFSAANAMDVESKMFPEYYLERKIDGKLNLWQPILTPDTKSSFISENASVSADKIYSKQIEKKHDAKQSFWSSLSSPDKKSDFLSDNAAANINKISSTFQKYPTIKKSAMPAIPNAEVQKKLKEHCIEGSKEYNHWCHVLGIPTYIKLQEEDPSSVPKTCILCSSEAYFARTCNCRQDNLSVTEKSKRLVAAWLLKYF